MNKTHYAIISIIIAFFLIGIFVYPQLPDKLASHWNSSGEVNDYTSKFFGTFLMPLISIFIAGLFFLIPKIDPLKKNIKKFRKYFDIFILFILIFMFYIYVLTILWNFGYQFNMNLMIMPAIALLFYFIGIIMPKLKRNWFMGIRTPWTLSNDTVWEKTHKIGGTLFKVLALVFVISMFFENYMLYIILIPVFSIIIYLFIYSYLEFQKLRK